MEWDSTRFHPATENGMQLKTYESFISGILHLMVMGHRELGITETLESCVEDGAG